MPETTPTPGAENAIAEPLTTGSEPDSEEAAVAAFAATEAQATPTDEPEGEPEPEDEPDDESTEEPSDGEPEEDEKAGALVEVEFNGVTAKVPPEFEKALLRQADYSRKMNEVSTKEKAATQRIETADKLIENAGEYAKVLAESNAIEAQITRFETVQWQQLRQENPAEYAALAADFQSLRLAKSEADQKAEGLDKKLAKDKDTLTQASRAEKSAEMAKVLDKELPGWQGKVGAELTEYARTLGYTDAQISDQSLDDPKWAVAMNKARKFDALQANKTAIKAKAQDAPPVMKPGAPRKPNVKFDAMERLRKSNSSEDAVAAFLARQR